METTAEKIRELVIPLFEQEGVVLVDLILFRRERRSYLRFLIDKPRGGITLEECTVINQKIGQLLDSIDVIQEHYILEVSSPGLDRPLATQSDFNRVIGRDVRFFLKNPLNNKLEIAGQVQSVDESAVTVVSEGAEIKIPLEAVAKAKQII